MDPHDLWSAAQALVLRHGAPGTLFSRSDVERLRDAGLSFPAHYLELASSVPLAGQVYQKGRDQEVMIHKPARLIEENRRTMPGLALVQSGFVVIGSDIASGDAFAVTSDGSDPSVYFARHDACGEDEPYPRSKLRKTAGSLAELFAKLR